LRVVGTMKAKWRGKGTEPEFNTVVFRKSFHEREQYTIYRWGLPALSTCFSKRRTDRIERLCDAKYVNDGKFGGLTVASGKFQRINLILPLPSVYMGYKPSNR
jgi:hypothetical protein